MIARTFEINWVPLTPANRWYSGHWSGRAERSAEWRAAGTRAARMHNLAQTGDPFHVVVQARHKTNHLTDADAFAPAAKAIVDGLIDYGLAPDDRAEFFKGLVLLPSFLDRTQREALIVSVRPGGPLGT